MDENSKIAGDGGAPKSTTTEAIAVDEANPSSNGDDAANLNGGVAAERGSGVVRTQSSSRTPFTNLSQVDADLALARTLQEQERAYMMLTMDGGIGYGRWDTGLYVHDDEDDDFGDSHDHEYDDEDVNGEEVDEGNVDNYDDDDDDDDEEEEEEDAFDVHANTDSGDNGTNRVELNSSAFPDDEAFARALQDAEEREMASRLLAMAGISEREIVDEDEEEHEDNSQDTWEEVDPDDLSYEELIALGEVVGTESRGLSADRIASLPSTNYKSQKTEEVEIDSCVICRLDYEDGDALTTLPCKHAYHSECINNWLKINKACPVCSTEVSTSGNS